MTSSPWMFLPVIGNFLDDEQEDPVGEACSRKSTFRPHRGFVFMSGLCQASSKFRKFDRISDLLVAYFFLQKLAGYLTENHKISLGNAGK